MLDNPAIKLAEPTAPLSALCKAALKMVRLGSVLILFQIYRVGGATMVKVW